MTKYIIKADFIDGPKDIKTVSSFLSSLRELMNCGYEYRLMLNIEDSIQMISHDIELGLFGGGSPDQIFMSPSDFQSISEILRRDEQSD